MNHLNTLYDFSTDTRYFGPALVQEMHSEDKVAIVSLEQLGEYAQIPATIAMADSTRICPGDSVLVLGEDIEHLFVIGILSQSKKPASSRIRTSDGITAEVIQDKKSEKLEISKDGKLLMQFEGDGNSCTIFSPAGNINFTAPKGKITFQANNGIQLGSDDQITMQTKSAIHLVARDDNGQRAQVGLNPHQVDFRSRFFKLNAQKGQLNVQDTTFSGTKFRATIKVAKLISDKVDTVANTIRERAKNIYTKVDELLHTTSGRSRTLVKSSSHLKAKRIYEIAEEDVKIDGNKIHLG